jgi:hypothetical protein
MSEQRKAEIKTKLQSIAETLKEPESSHSSVIFRFQCGPLEEAQALERYIVLVLTEISIGSTLQIERDMHSGKYVVVCQVLRPGYYGHCLGCGNLLEDDSPGVVPHPPRCVNPACERSAEV